LHVAPPPVGGTKGTFVGVAAPGVVPALVVGEGVISVLQLVVTVFVIGEQPVAVAVIV